jgi:uncharacterized protein (DUF58 family)
MIVIIFIFVIIILISVQSRIYFRSWFKNISLSLSFSESAAVEGDHLYLTEVITNRKLLPLPWLAVKFQMSRYLWFADRDNTQISDDFYRNDLFNLLPYRRITRRLPFQCGKRGFYTVKSADLISFDLLAINKFTKPASCRAALTVYPKPIDLDNVLHIHKQFLGQILTKRYIQPDPFEFKGIREYQPHDSLRLVNFKATAKTGGLMVNVHDYTVTQEIILFLNMQHYNAYPSEALFEQTIRLTASLAAYYISQSIPIQFVTNAYIDKAGTVRLESGSGHNHLTTLNELLAHVDVSREAVISGSALLYDEISRLPGYKQTGREPAYVIISTDNRAEFIKAHAELTEKGVDTLWLIPAQAFMEVKVPLTERVVRVDMEV